MRAAHLEAFIARLSAHPALAGKVHDSAAPLAADSTVVRASYVIVYDLGPDMLDDDRLTVVQSPYSDGVYRWVTRCVGVTPFAARAVHDAVAEQLTGHRLSIAGRVSGPIELDPADEPVQRDTAVTPPLYFIEADWVATSSRA